MGLFSRKKKEKVPAPAAARPVGAAPAPPQAAPSAPPAVPVAHAAVNAPTPRELAAKAAADAEERRERKILADITAKRKDIEQLQRALNGFEEERRREAALAKKANQDGKKTEAKAHLRNATRLKNRMAQYEQQVITNQTQLDALEDAAFQRQGIQKISDFTDNIESMKQDPEQIDDTLAKMREAMAGVNEGNLAFQADANLNQSAYETDDLEAELAALDEEFGTTEAQPTAALPSVPGTLPTMPDTSAAMSKEDEEIRQLEAGIML